MALAGVAVVLELAGNGSRLGLYAKIGKTTDLKARMKQYNVGRISELPIVFVYQTDHIDEIEQCIKENLKKYQLKNKTEIFNNLCFHGGPGNVLEMRVFSKKSIIAFLTKSGFIDIIFYEINEDMNKYGIFWDKKNCNTCSLMISAKKPKGKKQAK